MAWPTRTQLLGLLLVTGVLVAYAVLRMLTG